MKLSIVPVLMLGLLVQCSSNVNAQRFMAYGPTTGDTVVSCGTFTNVEKGSLQRQAHEWWVLGFVTGAGHILEGEQQVALARSDTKGLEEWVAKYCTDHPLDNLVTAAIALVDELRARGKG